MQRRYEGGSATDNAGNVGSDSGSFTVTVTPSSLCNLTKRYVQGSAKYQGLKANQKTAVDKRLTKVCDDVLAQIKPGITPMKKNALIGSYNDVVRGFASEGLLTQAQAAQLSGFTSGL